MQSKKSRALLLFMLCFVPALSFAQRYTVTDLGPLSPTGINSWAQVVGNYNNQGYIWAFGRMRPLGILPGGTFSFASAINDLGVVTGTADGKGTVVAEYWGYASSNLKVHCSNLIQPFVWKQRIEGLGTVGPASNVVVDDPSTWCSFPFYGAAINSLNQVAGYTTILPNEYQWGFSWTINDGMTLFGGGWPPTFTHAISNTGQIVGVNSSGGNGSATWWKDGVNLAMAYDSGTSLPDLGILSSASGVNDLGQIVGWSATDFTSDGCFERWYMPCDMQAVLWSPAGDVTELGTLAGDALSSAKRINAFGLVIGTSGNSVARKIDGQSAPIYALYPEVSGRPFIWSRGSGMRDLNTLIPQNSGWVLQSADDINVWGQIVGSGTRDGQPRGYLLTPLNPFQVF